MLAIPVGSQKMNRGGSLKIREQERERDRDRKYM